MSFLWKVEIVIVTFRTRASGLSRNKTFESHLLLWLCLAICQQVISANYVTDLTHVPYCKSILNVFEPFWFWFCVIYFKMATFRKDLNENFHINLSIIGVLWRINLNCLKSFERHLHLTILCSPLSFLSFNRFSWTLFTTCSRIR